MNDHDDISTFLRVKIERDDLLKLAQSQRGKIEGLERRIEGQVKSACARISYIRTLEQIVEAAEDRMPRFIAEIRRAIQTGHAYPLPRSVDPGLRQD